MPIRIHQTADRNQIFSLINEQTALGNRFSAIGNP